MSTGANALQLADPREAAVVPMPDVDAGVPQPSSPTGLPANVRRLRRHARTRVRVRALLHKGEAFQSTVVHDISLGGAGLSGAYGIFPGDRVTISLLTGQSVEGHVRWWLNGCCGVEFIDAADSEDSFVAAVMKPRVLRLR